MVVDETDDFLHFFTLPNWLDKPKIVQLLQHNMAAYQLKGFWQWNGWQMEGEKEEHCKNMAKEAVEKKDRDVGQDEERIATGAQVE